jgi:hypothetical protein
MRERPILFSSEMVCAILDGRKTMTRRVVKNQPGPTTVGYTELCSGHFNPVRSLRAFGGDIGNDDHKRALGEIWADEKNKTLTCPCGQPGDLLWVKETWVPDPPINGWPGDIEWNGCGRPIAGVPKLYQHPEFCIYKASWDSIDLSWRSPIFMPRWASRLTLEITAVRVERVQDISEEDAKAEGIQPSGEHQTLCPGRSYRNEFAVLWNTLNAKRGYGWDANPWVWVISFKRVQP